MGGGERSSVGSGCLEDDFLEDLDFEGIIPV